MAEVAETLAKLHSSDFAHRDLKPQNLMVYNGRWVLIDLGLVSYPEKPEETPADGKLGPAHFLAPEMLSTAGAADGKPADVYLLAKTLWVLATGQRYPWAGEQPASNAGCRLESWVAHPRAHLLNDLLDRATRHKPSDRPTARQFGSELRTWLEPPTTAALPANEFRDRSTVLASLSSPAREEQVRIRHLMQALDALHVSVWERVSPYTRKALASTGLEAVKTSGHELVQWLEARTLGYGKPARSAQVALKLSSPTGATLETGVCSFFYPTKHPDLGELFRIGAGHLTRVPIMTMGPGFEPNILTLAEGRCNTAGFQNQVNQLVSDYVNSLNQALDEFEKAVRKLSGYPQS